MAHDQRERRPGRNYNPNQILVTVARGSGSPLERLLLGTKLSARQLLYRQQTNIENCRPPSFELIPTTDVPLYVEVDQIYNLPARFAGHYQHDPGCRPKTASWRHKAGNGRQPGEDLSASTAGVRRPDSSQPESYWGRSIRRTAQLLRRRQSLCETMLSTTTQDNLDVGWPASSIPAAHAPNDGRVVSNFIVQALRGQPITVYGKGQQTRSFCYVDDLIDGFLRFMALEPPFAGPLNLGNPGEFTIVELAEQVINLTGSASRLVFSALPSDDPMQRRPDISRPGRSWIGTDRPAEGRLDRRSRTSRTAAFRPSGLWRHG